MSDKKKENLFAKLAAQQTKSAEEDVASVEDSLSIETPPPPALPEPAKRKAPVAKKVVETVKGKRNDENYCQANAYIPKELRRTVEKALVDIDELDYSTLVETLLKDWVKKHRVSG